MTGIEFLVPTPGQFLAVWQSTTLAQKFGYAGLALVAYVRYPLCLPRVLGVTLS